MEKVIYLHLLEISKYIEIGWNVGIRFIKRCGEMYQIGLRLIKRQRRGNDASFIKAKRSLPKKEPMKYSYN